ncbi:MAG: acyl-CoA dehydrogenase family protein [Acidimicrobiales bacterium]
MSDSAATQTPATEISDPAAFRQAVRSFFDTTVPAVLDGVSGDVARGKAYRAALFDAGLAGLDYPKEFGGQGATPEQQSIFAEESEGRCRRSTRSSGSARAWRCRCYETTAPTR